MNFFKYLLFFLMIVIIGSSMYVATLDAQYDMKVTKTLKLPMSFVFDEISDLETWKKWHVVLNEGGVENTHFSDTITGVGAGFNVNFEGDEYAVKTEKIIVNNQILQQINWGSQLTATSNWDFIETENGVEVSWGMQGVNSFQQKIYWLLHGGVEKNMLPHFTKGMEKLERYLVAMMEEHSIVVQGAVDYGGGFYLYKTTSSRMEALQEVIPTYFSEVSEYMKANNIASFGHPFVIYHQLDAVNKTALISTCYPVNERIITEGDVLTGFMEPKKTYKTTVKGDHKFIRKGWDISYKAIQKKGLIPLENGEPFEIYQLSKNNTLNPTLWVTEIYIPIVEEIQPTLHPMKSF